MTVRALELFCGIGGFAAAAAGTNIRVAGAVDQSPMALDVYRLNFPGHDVCQLNLENVTAEELKIFGADFWWLSPPCQPYTVRGAGRDIEDPRALSFRRILDVMARMPETNLPRHLALENVEGFARSAMRRRLIDLLVSRGFQFQECILCPTELGVPMRRPRYYLMASRVRLSPPVVIVDMPCGLSAITWTEEKKILFLMSCMSGEMYWQNSARDSASSTRKTLRPTRPASRQVMAGRTCMQDPICDAEAG